MTACLPTSKPEQKWRTISERAMRRGEFTICQYGHAPDQEYGLFGAGPEMLAHAKTYRELMDKADELSNKGEKQ